MNGQCEKIGELVAEYSTPLQRLPQGITTVKIAIIEKKESARGTMRRGNGGRRGLASTLFPSHRPPHALFFSSPQPPYDTKRPLRRKVIKLYYKSIFNEHGFSVHNIVTKND